MINSIYIDGKLITERIKCKKQGYFIMEDGSKVYDISTMKLRKNTFIKCIMCAKLKQIQYITKNHYINKPYKCFSCNKIGSLNGFYGKKHSDEFKNRLSKERMGINVRGEDKRSVYQCWVDNYGIDEANRRLSIWAEKASERMTGEKNPFFGKTHPPEILKKILLSGKEWREH